MRTKLLLIMAIASVFSLSLVSAAVVWESDWSSGQVDDNLWVRPGWSPLSSFLVADGPLGADNLRVTYSGASGALLVAENAWAAPAIGETQYYRTRFYVDTPAAASTGTDHGLQSNIGYLNWAFRFESNPSSPNVLQHFGIFLGNGQREYFLYQQIERRRPYRLEWAITRNSGSSATYNIRVYDEQWSLTTPRWTNTDFTDNWDGAGSPMPVSGGAFTFDSVPNAFSSATIGVSGQTGANTVPNVYIYYDDFAVCDDWCGAPGSGGTSHPDADLPFYFDWDGPTGPSVAALSSQGNLTDQCCTNLVVQGEYLGEVIPATGLDFPTTNVFRGMVYEDGQQLGYTVRRQDPSYSPNTVPAIGEYQFTRYYVRFNAQEDDNPGHMHFLHWGGTSDFDMWATISPFQQPDGSYGVHNGQIGFGFDINPNEGTGIERPYSATLDVDETYRFEVRIERTGSNTAIMDVQVYDSANNLVATSTDFTNSDGGNLGDDDWVITFSNADDFFRQWQVGPNNSVGLGGMSVPGYLYVSGFGVQTSSNPNDWIGPYGGSNPPAGCSDGATRQCGSFDVGVCSFGIETCSSGSWGSCVGAVGPVAEVCSDGLDNDCDGEVDDANVCTPPVGQDTNPVLWLPFDANNAVDASTYGNDGTNNGATWSNTGGPAGGYMTLDGTGDFIEVPHSASLDITDTISIAAWVNTPGDGYDNIAIKGPIGTYYGFFLFDRTFEYNINGWSGTSTQTVPTNTWTHVALTYDGTNVVVYRDGQAVITRAHTGAFPSNTGPLMIGRLLDDTTGFFSGSLDEVMVFNRGLSASEVNFLATNPGSALCEFDNSCGGSGTCSPEGAVQSCGTDVGVCSTGSQFCTSGSWSACIGGVSPVTEVCNDGLDNDCDGQVDESCFNGLPGDYNLDGVIDFRDLVNVLSKLGRTGMSGDAADANADGDVDLFDLVLVARSWQRPVAAGISVQQVTDQLRVQIDTACPAESGRCQVRRVSPTQVTLADGPTNTVQVFDDSVVAGTQYTYNVRYWDADWGAESLHAEASVTVTDPNLVDTTPPVITLVSPSAGVALAVGTTSTPFSLFTNEAATCKWSTVSQGYDAMPNTMSGSGSTSHSATFFGLVDGQSYTRYYRCRDSAGNTRDGPSVSFSVDQQSSSPSGIVWQADWSTATGTSTNAIFDGGNFQSELCDNLPSHLTVIPDPTGLFPTTNVLQIDYIDRPVPECNMVGANQQWAEPAVGEYLFSRVYMYADIDVGEDAVGHWFHHGSNEFGNDYPFFWSGQDTDVSPDGSYTTWAAVGPAGGTSGRGSASFAWHDTQTHQLYRFETRIHRTSSTTITIDVRVSDGVTGVRIVDSQDFLCESGCDFNNFLIDHIGEYPVTYSPGIAGLTSLEIGNNGPAQQPDTIQYRYIGAPAIALSDNANDWIGAHPGEGSGSTPALIFESDWSTATGSSDTALSDGGVWDENQFQCVPEQRQQVLGVVDAASVGFPLSDNVMRITHLGPGTCGLINVNGALPRGEDFWMRVYLRNDETQGVSNHPLNLHGGYDDVAIQTVLMSRLAHGANGWTLRIWPPNPAGPSYQNGYRPTSIFLTGDPSNPGPGGNWGESYLQNGVWYRYELYVDFIGGNDIRMYPRVYDMNDNLLHDYTTFVQGEYGGLSQWTLEDYYDLGHVFSLNDLTYSQNINFGQEGPASDPNSGESWYAANLAFSTEGWIGPSGGNQQQADSLAWHCDWDYQTGNSHDAVQGRDLATQFANECFNVRTSQTLEALDVIPAPAGQGWPAEMSNVLRIDLRTPPGEQYSPSKLVVAENAFDPPEVGEYLFQRMYVYNDMQYGDDRALNRHFFHFGTGYDPDATGGSQPGWCAGSSGCYSFRWFYNSAVVQQDGSIGVDASPMFNQQAGPGQGSFRNADTFVDRVEIWEMRIYRNNATGAYFDVRKSLPDGTIISTSEDFICSAAEPTGCMDNGGSFWGPTPQAIGEYPVTITDWNRVNGLEIGSNGGWGPSQQRYLYVGGAAVRFSNDANDWIGLYPVGQEND